MHSSSFVNVLDFDDANDVEEYDWCCFNIDDDAHRVSDMVIRNEDLQL